MPCELCNSGGGIHEPPAKSPIARETIDMDTPRGTDQGTKALMNDDYKIYVDAGRPATLNDGAGEQTDCATLQEAVIAWHKLAPERKIRATVKIIGGPVYRSHEIERLHYGPKPG